MTIKTGDKETLSDSAEVVDLFIADYIDRYLAPTVEERAYIQAKYEHVTSVLEGAKCLLVGSYARATDVRPASDMDLLCLTEATVHDSSRKVLDGLAQRLSAGLTTSRQETINVKAKTCTIEVDFVNNETGMPGFSIEIVPAIQSVEKSPAHHLYWVPKRPIETKTHQVGVWQLSDPFYYMARANQIETKINNDFRSAVRLAKGWLTSVKTREEFILKSFHLELIVGEIYLQDPGATNLGLTGVFRETLRQLPSYIIEAPVFRDPADDQRFSDGYLVSPGTGSSQQRNKIIAQAQAGFSLANQLNTCRDKHEAKCLLDALMTHSNRKTGLNKNNKEP